METDEAPHKMLPFLRWKCKILKIYPRGTLYPSEENKCIFPLFAPALHRVFHLITLSSLPRFLFSFFHSCLGFNLPVIQLSLDIFMIFLMCAQLSIHPLVLYSLSLSSLSLPFPISTFSLHSFPPTPNFFPFSSYLLLFGHYSILWNPIGMEKPEWSRP